MLYLLLVLDPALSASYLMTSNQVVPASSHLHGLRYSAMPSCYDESESFKKHEAKYIFSLVSYSVRYSITALGTVTNTGGY